MKPPPRDPIAVVMVAVGNHYDGYRSMVRVEYAEGPDWYPFSRCDHRHRFTWTARRCARHRWANLTEAPRR